MKIEASRGFTLIETMIALGILALVLTVAFNMFQTSLHYSSIVKKRAFASVIAKKKMEEIRAWAAQKTGSNFNFDSDWSAWSGVSAPDPENPEYTVSISVGDQLLYSPSSTLEEIYSPENYGSEARRIIRSSMKKIRVKVTCDNSDTNAVSLVSLIRSPQRDYPTYPYSNPPVPLRINPFLIVDPSKPSPNIIVTPVSPIPSSLPKDSTIGFTVQAIDNDGSSLKDVFYRWYVYPMSGNGTVTQTRDGSAATFANYVLKWQYVDGELKLVRIYTGGKCRVMVRVVYWGGEQWGFSNEIELEN